MQKTVYENFKYSMQDVSRVYVGSKYTFEELLDDEDLLFKFRMIVERYILPEADLQDTLESHLCGQAVSAAESAHQGQRDRGEEEPVREAEAPIYGQAAHHR